MKNLKLTRYTSAVGLTSVGQVEDRNVGIIRDFVKFIVLLKHQFPINRNGN